ncbi:hypothetical protein B0J14DRAFT_650698 [Halenospora varia]|nr:hypothetical protein B0J14DRAFT_650698 [Halenospora varia]
MMTREEFVSTSSGSGGASPPQSNLPTPATNQSTTYKYRMTDQLRDVLDPEHRMAPVELTLEKLIYEKEQEFVEKRFKEITEGVPTPRLVPVGDAIKHAIRESEEYKAIRKRMEPAGLSSLRLQRKAEEAAKKLASPMNGGQVSTSPALTPSNFLVDMQPEPTLQQAPTPTYGSRGTLEPFFEPWQEPDSSSPCFEPSIPSYPRPRLPHGTFFPPDMRSIPNIFRKGQDRRPIRAVSAAAMSPVPIQPRNGLNQASSPQTNMRSTPNFFGQGQGRATSSAFNPAMLPVPIQPRPALHQASAYISDMRSTPTSFGQSQGPTATRAASNPVMLPVPIQPKPRLHQASTPTAVIWNTVNFSGQSQGPTSTGATFDSAKFLVPIAPRPVPGEHLQFPTFNVRGSPSLRPNPRRTQKALGGKPTARRPSMVCWALPKTPSTFNDGDSQLGESDVALSDTYSNGSTLAPSITFPQTTSAIADRRIRKDWGYHRARTMASNAQNRESDMGQPESSSASAQRSIQQSAASGIASNKLAPASQFGMAPPETNLTLVDRTARRVSVPGITATDSDQIISTELNCEYNMKKEKDNIKATSSFSRNQELQKKYPKLDGVSIMFLEEIEELQNEYATNGGAWLDMDVDRTCRGRLTLSDHGPWLELTRDFFPRRDLKSVEQYILIPLKNDNHWSDWQEIKPEERPGSRSEREFTDKEKEEMRAKGQFRIYGNGEGSSRNATSAADDHFNENVNEFENMFLRRETAASRSPGTLRENGSNATVPNTPDTAHSSISESEEDEVPTSEMDIDSDATVEDDEHRQGDVYMRSNRRGYLAEVNAGAQESVAGNEEKDHGAVGMRGGWGGEEYEPENYFEGDEHIQDVPDNDDDSESGDEDDLVSVVGSIDNTVEDGNGVASWNFARSATQDDRLMQADSSPRESLRSDDAASHDRRSGVDMEISFEFEEPDRVVGNTSEEGSVAAAGVNSDSVSVHNSVPRGFSSPQRRMRGVLQEHLRLTLEEESNQDKQGEEADKNVSCTSEPLSDFTDISDNNELFHGPIAAGIMSSIDLTDVGDGFVGAEFRLRLWRDSILPAPHNQVWYRNMSSHPAPVEVAPQVLAQPVREPDTESEISSGNEDLLAGWTSDENEHAIRKHRHFNYLKKYGGPPPPGVDRKTWRDAYRSQDEVVRYYRERNGKDNKVAANKAGQKGVTRAKAISKLKAKGKICPADWVDKWVSYKNSQSRLKRRHDRPERLARRQARAEEYAEAMVKFNDTERLEGCDKA